jgi:hypothetical protein
LQPFDQELQPMQLICQSGLTIASPNNTPQPGYPLYFFSKPYCTLHLAVLSHFFSGLLTSHHRVVRVAFVVYTLGDHHSGSSHCDGRVTVTRVSVTVPHQPCRPGASGPASSPSQHATAPKRARVALRAWVLGDHTTARARLATRLSLPAQAST